MATHSIFWPGEFLVGYSPWGHIFIMLYVTSLVLIYNCKWVHFAYLHPIFLLLPSVFK